MTERRDDSAATHSAATLVDLDKRYVWHPFTQMQEWLAATPLVIERAEGNYLIDTGGKRYLDGVASLWVNVHGHNHPAINRAILEQLEKVAHTTLLGLANVPSIELAARLAELAPGSLDKVFYSDSGSTAVEIALKQAFQYWRHRGQPRKSKFVHLDDAYHGDTLGAVAVGGIQLFHDVFRPLLVPSFAVPGPYRCRTADGLDGNELALDRLGTLLRDHAGETAAIIIEPLVQGAAGMLVQPSGYLREVAALCQRYEVLLIADEVATGFGRTGTMFACEQEGIEPDLMCLAKGISGGYLPLAATLATSEVYEAFLGQRHEYKTFFHGHTYTGNPLACAAGLASLAIFEEEKVLEHLPGKIEHLRNLLDQQVRPSPAVWDIRQKGFMVGIELRDRTTGQPFPAKEATGARVCLAARDRGVIIRPLGDVLVLMPPLSLTQEDAILLVHAVSESIREICT